ncbi:hypothetical protein A966_02856 [Brachyspira hampsonii 30446]|uniref:Uncharacterized protein n=1 Tax=Brachyspira hampsonii 30446 TaxID=1289135 RepID=A0A2U4F0R9_9SPIR|nr:hypothetical protein [Brachyspira hampsonii]EKV57822.1 hypothetical protein A966_02856 [Brachyspira hampsonii 30446]
MAIRFFTLTGLDTFLDFAFIASLRRVIDSLSVLFSVFSVLIDSIFLTGVEVLRTIFLSAVFISDVASLIISLKSFFSSSLFFLRIESEAFISGLFSFISSDFSVSDIFFFSFFSSFF